MRGINTKDHQVIVAAFQKFEQLASVVNNKISAEEDSKTREGVEELKRLHLRFRNLLTELDSCTKKYEERRKVVQSIMNKNIRKMNTQVKNNRVYSGRKEE